MSENNNVKITVENSNTSKKEYIKYSGFGSEKEAARAMYEYFNTGKYVNLIQQAN